MPSLDQHAPGPETSGSRSLSELRGELRSNGFKGAVDDDAATRTVYGTDNSIYQLRPVGAVIPSSAEDIAILARVNHTLTDPYELVARGGGTGTNGQSLTNGVVVDMRRSLNKILSIDVGAQEAVVQPGVVLGQLNAEIAKHDLFFAPHVSTATRATIGGMTSTDAAGKGSLVHGRTNKHILGIDACLPDGTPWSFGSTSLVEATAMAARTDRIGDLHRLILEATEGITADSFPEVPRGFTGYNLADARHVDERGDGVLDLSKLLCGSEGTLTMMSEIRIRLTPLPQRPHLVVVAYPNFEDAIRDSNRLKVSKPIAIECLDERTISLATGSPAWPTLRSMLNADGGSLLLMEFDGTEGIEQLQDMLGDVPGATDIAVTEDPAKIAAVWKVRADAVGLLGQAVDGRRSIPFVEDCAVPPRHLPEFVAGFREVLDRHGLSYGMFGHADVGCLHVRPALDLYDPTHEAMVRSVSDQVASLVASFGGVLWGEHGRGFRGEYVDLSDDVIHRMRMVKTAFDPRNVLNPGKLYAPLEGAPPIKKIDDVPLRIHRDRSVAEASREHFDSAFSCNGNGICHHWGGTEVMCPSFKATLDPRLSPKGRADLLRGWLANPDDAELADEVADSMRQCLSCGACTGRCPVQVDIPEMKSRFFEQHAETDRKRKLRDLVMSGFEPLLPTVQRVAGPVAFGQKLAAPLLEKTLGTVDLPSVPAGSLDKRLAQLIVPQIGPGDELHDATVIIVPDAFSAFIDPDVLTSTLRILKAMGEKPAVARFVPSGKYDHVKGRRKRFAKAVAKQRSMMEELSRHGVELVVIEPAVLLLHRHEYPAIDRSYPSQLAVSLPDFVDARIDALPPSTTPEGKGTIQMFSHCTEASITPGHNAAYRRLLERAGFTVEIEATSCCGMAGIFGHEAENQEMSTKLFDDHWRPKLEAGAAKAATQQCVSGYSCRSQAKRLDAPALRHPAVIVAEALGL